ncbi:diguanylate cyclase [Geminicoccaceae bacterium 1502E]|nr:diguanylate cyclase [Geminicoccaceae bacterium 1502E]
MPAGPGRVLVVDGSSEGFAQLETLLQRAGARRADWAPSGESGLRRLAAMHYDACLVAATLPDRDAGAFLAVAQRRGLWTPMLLIAGDGEEVGEEDALDSGFADLLDREDLDAGRLLRSLRLAVARHRQAERLDRLAQQDELTGLANRSLLRDRLQRALAGARRHGTSVAVVVLDLNGFKAVNDRLGHGAGDELLRQVGQRLCARLRETDTVARMGGDEFALVLENLARPEHAAIVVRKVLDAMAAPLPLTDGVAEISASLGVAVYPDDGAEPAVLLRKADRAMYEAKAEGGNTCRFHDAGLGAHLRRSSIIGSDLKRALDEQVFLLHFQPQLALQPTATPALSARAMLAHPELGLVAVEQFHELAAETGLVEPLNEWMLTAACARARLWQEAGLGPFRLGVPVLSRRQVSWARLAERVRERLQEFGLQRHAIELELTEQPLLEQREEAVRALEPLRQVGVGLAVEEFGRETGALSLLRDLPLSTLKFARGLLDPAAGDGAQRRFGRLAMRLGRELGLRVVACGPCSPGQLQLLREEGCDAVQQALDPLPLAPGAAAAWLEAAARTRSRATPPSAAAAGAS